MRVIWSIPDGASASGAMAVGMPLGLGLEMVLDFNRDAIFDFDRARTFDLSRDLAFDFDLAPDLDFDLFPRIVRTQITRTACSPAAGPASGSKLLQLIIHSAN